MADGDVTAVVNADGWSIDATIEGGGGVDWGGKAGTVTYANQATRYIFGSVDTAAGNMSLSVTSQGYSAGVLGTNVRTIFGTKSVRKPWSGTPNFDELDIDETAASNNLTVRIALSECIYDDDTLVTITTTAGWATDGDDDSNAASAVSVTNNSTLDYPKVIGQWDWERLRGGWRRMESNFTVGFRARHGYGIDQVTISAIGASSSVNTNENVTTLSKTKSANTGLYHESFQMAVALADYNQAEQIDLRAISYPLIGDADSLLDTNTTTAEEDRIRGLTTCFVMCDKTLGMRKYATVDADDGGDDSQGSFSTQDLSDGDPHKTIGGAIDDGANYILVLDSSATPEMIGSSVSPAITEGSYVEVKPHPDAGTITLERAATNISYATDYLCYENLTINYTSGNGWLDGAHQDRQLLFDNCTMVSAGAPTVGLGYRSRGCWFLNCSGLGTDDYVSLSDGRIAYSFTGNQFSSNFKCDCWYTNIANISTAVVTMDWDTKASENVAPVQNNILVEHNSHKRLAANGVGNTYLHLGVAQVLDGVHITGNELEVDTVTSSGPIFHIFGDGSTSTCNNIIIAHNTLAGERCNLFYNDSGSSAVLRTNVFVYGNAFRSYNIKADKFATENANRVGNWAQMWAVHYHDNIYDGSASSNFTGEYDGIRSSFELSGGLLTFGELGYIDEQSADLGTNGGGNYTPASGSVLLNASIVGSFIGFDLKGNANNSTEIGAIFIAATAQSGISAGLGRSIATGISGPIG